MRPFALTLVASLLLFACEQSGEIGTWAGRDVLPNPDVDDVPPGWTRVYDETFEEGSLGDFRTEFWWGGGYFDERPESYYASSNVRVMGGRLLLEAREGGENDRPYGAAHADTFGRFEQRYGFFAARITSPPSAAISWSFNLGSASTRFPPHVEIARYRGNAPGVVTFENYVGLGADEEPYERILGTAEGLASAPTSHVLALLWEPDRLTWFVDGKERFTTDRAVPDEAMYPVFDIQVEPAFPRGEGDLPAVLAVDYVRVYARTTPER